MRTMARTIDHIVETHKLAAERRTAGRPLWDEQIHILRTEDMSFEEVRDNFAAALKRSRWFKRETAKDEERGYLWQMWDEIKDAEDADHFDQVLDAIYDEADYARVWITFDAR
jgi:hypothetical protein